MENIQNCPICGHTNAYHFLNCIDQTYSKEIFSIVACSNCNFKFTSPRPDEMEIGNYYMSENYVSHSDNKKGFINKLYHVVKSYALIKKMQLVMHYSKRKGIIVDYGCGSGDFLNTCKGNGWEVYGVEPSDSARARINEKFGISSCQNNSELLTIIGDKKVDCITLWHVLEHIGNLEALFLLFENILAPNGKIVIAVPNPSSYDCFYYKEQWAAYDLPRHFYHFEPRDIRLLFSNHGYRNIKTLPMIFDSFYVSMLSEKNKGSKLGILRAFFIGLLSNVKAIKTGEKFSSQIYIFQRG